MKRSCRDTGCPLAFTLDLFGDRWSLLVVRDMLLAGKRNYGEFMDSPERVASNILADRLKRLEEACIIRKAVDPENQRKINYELTEKGLDLIPLILELHAWGAKYDPATQMPRRFLEAIRKDRDAVARDIVAAVRSGKSYLARYLGPIDPREPRARGRRRGVGVPPA